MFKGPLTLLYFIFQHICLKSIIIYHVSPFSGLGLLSDCFAGVSRGHICDYSHLVVYLDWMAQEGFTLMSGCAVAWPLSPHGLSVSRMQMQKLQGLVRSCTK